MRHGRCGGIEGTFQAGSGEMHILGGSKTIMLDFFKGKTILITGHTGFKGSWLSVMLEMAGANVVGYALQPPQGENLFGYTAGSYPGCAV